MRATQPRFLDLEQKYGSVIRGLEEAAKISQTAGLSRLQSAILKQSPMSGMSGARYNLFLSFARGMQTLPRALTAKLAPETVQLKTSVRALNFNRTERIWEIETENKDFLTAQAICLALPAHVIAKLLNKQFPVLAAELAAIEHASTATVNLGFKTKQITHPLDGFGFVVPFVEKRTLLACTFSSVKFKGRAPRNCSLLRAFVGGALQPEYFALDDKEMIARVMQDLRELVGVKGDPIFAQVDRWERSMPQYALGHLARIDRIKNLLAEIPSLTIATTAIDGVGVPDSVRRAELAAEQTVASLNKQQFLSRSSS
jgi:oxygen-dependent protoporphyrinogen oxidase